VLLRKLYSQKVPLSGSSSTRCPRVQMSARDSSAVPCWRAASVGRLDIIFALPRRYVLYLLYTCLSRGWSSLPSRWSACVERSATACHFYYFTSCFPQSPKDVPYLFRRCYTQRSSSVYRPIARAVTRSSFRRLQSLIVTCLLTYVVTVVNAACNKCM